MPTRSFAAFLTDYGEAHQPLLRYRAGDDFPAWQARFGLQLQQLRGDLPARVEPVARVLETVTEPDHLRCRLEIAVSAISSLPAYLLLPLDLQAGEQRPALLVSHGHHKYGMAAMCGTAGMDEGDGALHASGLSAVRAGYVVLAPAWWGWPPRDGHLSQVGNRDRCNVIQMAASMYGLNVLDLHIQEAQAALDVLVRRPEVDAARIGCIGNSYGGRTAMWFTIFDPRIKACVAAGCSNVFRERSQALKSCAIQCLPGLLRYGDVPELFSLIAPRPLQLQSGASDALITPADLELIAATVGEAYRLTAARDNFEDYRHAAGHLLIWDAAADFLARHL